MTEPRLPKDSHDYFDAICAQVGEWETLPSVKPEPGDEERPAVEQEAVPLELDRLIMAGLVSPV
jgi:hypothetical protein